jgi:hypothetical protein
MFAALQLQMTLLETASPSKYMTVVRKYMKEMYCSATTAMCSSAAAIPHTVPAPNAEQKQNNTHE